MRQTWQVWVAALLLVLSEAQSPTDEEILRLFDPSVALAMGRLSAYTYCGPQLKPERVEQCPECENAGFKVLQDSVKLLFVPFHTNKQANFFILGQFLRTDEAKGIPSKGCFVATRGTAVKVNWAQNMLTALMDPKFIHCPDCRVHTGYHIIYKNALPSILQHLDSHGCGKDGDPIWITGHSMGGAVGSILVAGLVDQGYNVLLSYVMEPPQTGNEAYRQFFLNYVAKSHPPVPLVRLTNGQDWTPRFLPSPPYEGLDYEFYSDPAWGRHQVCRNTSSGCGVEGLTQSFWTKKSLYFDHIVLWYAPKHFMTLSMTASQWCEPNPNPLLLQLELAQVGVYVFLTGAGFWGFVFRLTLMTLVLAAVVAACVRCCCRSMKDRKKYSKIAEPTSA